MICGLLNRAIYDDFERYSTSFTFASLFKWDFSYSYTAVDKISTDMARRAVPLIAELLVCWYCCRFNTRCSWSIRWWVCVFICIIVLYVSPYIYISVINSSLFGWKLGFHRILDSLHGAFQRLNGVVGHSEQIVRDWPWQIWGAIPAEVRAGEPGEIFVFFCEVSNARFYPFPIGQISRNFNTTRRSVPRWILSEQDFENFPVRGRSSKKCKNAKFS